MIVSPAWCFEPVFTQLSSRRNIAVQHELQLQTYPSRLRVLQ
jgi:hypothetical protein